VTLGARRTLVSEFSGSGALVDAVYSAPVNGVPDGGPPEALATPWAVTGYAVGTSGIYMTSSTGVWSMPLAGGTPTNLWPSTNLSGPIFVDSQNAYVATSGSILALPLSGVPDGGAPTILAAGIAGPSVVAIDATYVYRGGSDGTIAKIPLAGLPGSTPTLLAAGQSIGLGLTVDATSVYWLENGGQAVMKLTPK